MSGDLVNKGELSKIFDLSIHVIDRAIARGAPHTKGKSKKDGYRFDTARFFEWFIEDKCRTVDPYLTAQTELMHTIVKLKQHQLAALEAETLTIPEAMALYSDEAAVIRKHTLAIPGRCAAQVAAESDPSVIEGILMDEVNLALAKISGEGDSEDAEL